MRALNRLHPLTAGACFMALVTSAQADAILIDDFDDRNNPSIGTTPATIVDPGVLGGERDGVAGDFSFWDINSPPSILHSSANDASLTLVYDGTDGNPNSTDVEGLESFLGGVSATDSVWFVSSFDFNGTPIGNNETNDASAIVTIHSTSGSSTSAVIDLDGTGIFQSPALGTFTGTADVTDIGAIEIAFTTTASWTSDLDVERIVIGDSPNIPEPAAGLIAMLGGTLIALRRRRRR